MIVPHSHAFGIIFALVISLSLASQLLAQERLTIDQLMTPEEQARTGVESLTPVQQAELETWITAWTRYVAEYAQEKAGVKTEIAYPGVGSGHWVSEVKSGGSTILLNDWSEWEINSSSRHLVADWLPTTQITVVESDQPRGEYAYLLVNKMEDETALARYKGRK
jgi:hypothetical protein